MSKSAKKKEVKKFTIDCSNPCGDDIFDIKLFGDFLKTRVKVDGKTGNLGEKVEIAVDGTSVSVKADAPFSKRYLKYLTKKYLKKHDLREYLHVIASDPTTYELRYFNIDQMDDDDGDDE